MVKADNLVSRHFECCVKRFRTERVDSRDHSSHELFSGWNYDESEKGCLIPSWHGNIDPRSILKFDFNICRIWCIWQAL